MLGTFYTLNINVGLPEEQVKTLDESFNYEILLRLVDEVMKVRHNLLEEVALSIEKRILDIKPIAYLRISIRKKFPPLGSEVEASEIILEKSY